MRYEIAEKVALRGVVYCHCSMCRKTHGHAAAYTSVTKKALRMTQSVGLKWYASSEVARRGFCQNCGGSLFYETLAAESIEISAGTFDLPTGLGHVGHIYAGSKSDYYDISDDKPQCPEDDEEGIFRI